MNSPERLTEPTESRYSQDCCLLQERLTSSSAKRGEAEGKVRRFHMRSPTALSLWSQGAIRYLHWCVTVPMECWQPGNASWASVSRVFTGRHHVGMTDCPLGWSHLQVDWHHMTPRPPHKNHMVVFLEWPALTLRLIIRSVPLCPKQRQSYQIWQRLPSRSQQSNSEGQTSLWAKPNSLLHSK